MKMFKSLIESKGNLSAKVWLCIGLCLCLISMIVSNMFLTSGGKVKINDLNIVIPSGETIRFYEYRPNAATKQNPAPAVIFSHGNDSTLQTHQDYAFELARRGFVVFAPDITSAGKSSKTQDTSTISFGVYDLIDYVFYTLDYIDKSRIGVAGYSKGGNNVYGVLNAYGIEQSNHPDKYVQRISAGYIMDPRFLPTDAFAKGINVGFSCATHDPFNRISFTSVEGYLPGDLSVKPEMKKFINDGVPGTFSEMDLTNPSVKVEIGKVYGNYREGNARVVYNPEYATHASAVFAKTSIRDCVDFFCNALGAPINISSNKIISRWHIFFAAIGLLGIIIMIVPLTSLLLDTRVFNSLKKQAGEAVIKFDSIGKKAALLIPSLALGFILALTPTVFGTWPAKFLSIGQIKGMNRFFLNSWQNGIMFWLFINAIIALAVFVVIYFIIHKKNGVSLREAGVNATLFGALKTVLLAITVFVICYFVTCFADYTLKVDFRLQDLTFPVMTWERLLLCMRYAPFVIFYWCVNSMNMNGFCRLKGMSEIKNILLCVGLNIVGLIIVLAVYYAKLFGTGVGLGAPFVWKYYTTMLLFVPIAISGTVVNRIIYLKTSNVFVGPVIFGMIATIFSTAVMMLPDFIY